MAKRKATKNIDTPEEDRKRFVITDDEIFAIQDGPLAVELDYNPYEKRKLTQSVADLMKLRSQSTKI
jgi:hypothetical protein